MASGRIKAGVYLSFFFFVTSSLPKLIITSVLFRPFLYRVPMQTGRKPSIACSYHFASLSLLSSGDAQVSVC